MANNKEFFTRVQLKYDTWKNWDDVKSTFKPLAGEVCLVQIPEGASSGMQDTPPSVLLKVGNGTDFFENLPWMSGLAADVHAWAKKSSTDFIAWVQTQLSYVTPGDLADIEARIQALEEWRAGLNVTSKGGLVKGLSQSDGKIAYETATGADIPDHGYKSKYTGTEPFSHVKVVDTLTGNESAFDRVVPSVKAVKELAADLESIETEFGKLNVSVTGTGNAVTTGSYDDKTRTITLTKGATYNNYSLPTATNTTLGGVKLSDSIEDDKSVAASSGIAATPKAVNAVKALADAAQADASTALEHIANLYGGTIPTDEKYDSILEIVDKEIASAVSNNASFDTLKEIAAWIAAHPESVSAINESLQEVRKEVYGTANGTTADPSRIDANAADISNIKADIAAMDYSKSASDKKFITSITQTDGKITGVTYVDLAASDIPAHATTSTTYGGGTGSNYGHVKLSDATNSTSGASSSIAATPAAVKAVKDAVDGLSSDIQALSLDDLVPNGDLNTNDRYVIFNCGSATKLV